MRPVRSVVMWLAVVLGLTGALAVAGPAQADAGGYYQASYSDTIYSVTDGRATALSYAQWVAAGRPVPKAATVAYATFSWDPTIYRTTSFGPWPEFGTHIETLAEWIAARRPAPGAGEVHLVVVTRWATGEELFATTPDALVHRLSKAQWDEVGDVTPRVEADQGYEKLSWAPAIAKMTSLTRGTGAPVSYAQWAAAGLPTPRPLPRIPGDRFYRYPGEQTVYYAGPTMNRAVTFAEWRAAGSPTPTAPPPGAPPHTAATSITPVPSPGRVGAGYTVTSTTTGTCTGSSEAGTDLGGATAAYRCFTGNAVLDPCWNAGTTPTSVLCLSTPWSTSTTRVRLPGAPDRTLLSGAGQSYPWGLALADGRRCVSVQGSHGLDGGRALDYSCTDGTQVLDGIDDDAPAWRVDTVKPTASGYTAAVSAAVKTAWYVTPSS